MRHRPGLQQLFAFLVGACPRSGVADEPCAPSAGSDAALFAALRAGDTRGVSSAWEALVHAPCPGEPVAAALGTWTASSAVREAWDWTPAGRRSGTGWVPSVSVAASAAPAWRATTRLDAGRSVVARMDWSVGLSLRFTSRRRMPALAWTGELSRAEARRTAEHAASTFTAADATSLYWRVDTVARRVGARVDHLLEEARSRQETPPAPDLRARVLDAVARQEELALLAAWLGGGTHP